MASGGGAASAEQLLEEGILLVLSRWTALQMAVQNEWGGRDSPVKAQELAASILDWFRNSNEALYIDDLENILDECMVMSFNAEIEDGSVEEVAEQLMVMHEECLQGKSDLLCRLRESAPGPSAVSQSRQIVGENEDPSSDEEASDMMVDEPKPEVSTSLPKQRNSPDEDGWSVVAHRKSRR